MRGLSVWLFSKVVMVIFLLTVFTTVIGFMKLLNDRVSSDAAESLVIEAQQTASSVITNDAVEMRVIMPVPASLPQPGWGTLKFEGGEATRPFSMKVFKFTTPSGDTAISFAVAFGTYTDETDVRYNAASALTLPAGITLKVADPQTREDGVFFNSRDYPALVFKKTDNGKTLCILACNYAPGNRFTCKNKGLQAPNECNLQ
ncbi:hypothetical protein HYS54_04235 [Candidatus Micrarchaeota archaeon]|nr:hypothetical protein [Candidatus Micrarchaeota archaeon]